MFLIKFFHSYTISYACHFFKNFRIWKIGITGHWIGLDGITIVYVTINMFHNCEWVEEKGPILRILVTFSVQLKVFFIRRMRKNYHLGIIFLSTWKYQFFAKQPGLSTQVFLLIYFYSFLWSKKKRRKRDTSGRKGRNTKLQFPTSCLLKESKWGLCWQVTVSSLSLFSNQINLNNEIGKVGSTNVSCPSKANIAMA